MDKGAHYHKCDFQVHTPRDINWSGGNAVTTEERKAYAQSLIRACRVKGIDAIAITDHHDLTFFPYIKQAAANEADEQGTPLPAEKQLVVFPGIELTLDSPNCQALLLLDADFPENLLTSVLTALSISPASDDQPKTAQVQRIPQTVIGNFGELYQKLSALTYLKDRFIVFPNVSDGGHGTLMRQGFQNFYAEMPCVGGYVDGPITQIGTKRDIVDGKSRHHGNRAIGLFQTSDNRRADHSILGNHSTWVKWSRPTAEALRQACLARFSRLSQELPKVPSSWVMSISVTDSKFLGGDCASCAICALCLRTPETTLVRIVAFGLGRVGVTLSHAEQIRQRMDSVDGRNPYSRLRVSTKCFDRFTLRGRLKVNAQ